MGNLSLAAENVLFEDPDLSRAEKLLNSGRFEEALLLLRRVAPSHPQPLDAYFLLGLSALETADRVVDENERNALLDEAIFVLHSILVAHPNFYRARLELARAFFLKGDDELAKEHFERVLADVPNTQAADRINQFLVAIRARRRWDGYFSLAIAPDSNINTATEAQEVDILGFRFRLNKNARRRSGLGAVISTGGEYRLPLNAKTQWRTGIDFTRSDHAGGNYDQTIVGLHAGPRFFLSSQTAWSVLATAGKRWIAGNRYSHQFGGRLEANHRVNQRLMTRASAFWTRVSHRQHTASDGFNVGYLLSGDYYFSPTILANVYAGLNRSRPRTRGSRNRGHKIGGGVQWSLPKGWTVGGSVDRSQTVFREAAFGTDGARRRDKGLTTALFALNRSLTIGGFSPQLKIVRTNYQSNATLSRYQRNRAELRLVRQF